MGSTEKWGLAAIVVVAAFYAFGLNALYLVGVIGLIYLFSRPSRSHRR